MATFYKLRVAQTMLDTGLVPAFYHHDIATSKEVMRACYEGGIRIFEFTNRGDFAHEVFRELVIHAQKSFPEMILGVGSIVDPATASLYIQLGANFVVSPILHPEVAKICHRRKVLWVPGCGSLSEISQAEELGSDIQKIFPASGMGGPDFVKAVLGPCPWSLLMPTGGVTPDDANLKAWFEAGVACVGMGSQLFPKEVLQAGQYDWIAKTASAAMNSIAKYRRAR